MRRVVVVIASVLCAVVSPAWAQKDKDHGAGHGGPPAERIVAPASTSKGAPPPSVEVVIPDRDRTAVNSYYRTEYVAGNCPPGLAKKGNGCLPPGQAKKLWVIGQPLPASMVYYPLPPALVLQLTPPPMGHEYVRVANDILLLAVGTRLVAGAVADLSSVGNLNR